MAIRKKDDYLLAILGREKVVDDYWKQNFIFKKKNDVWNENFEIFCFKEGCESVWNFEDFNFRF